MHAFSPESLFRALAAVPPARRYWVAYSGGLDSEVLLHALASSRPRWTAEIHAIHVDHGLQPDLVARVGLEDLYEPPHPIGARHAANEEQCRQHQSQDEENASLIAHW